MRYVLATVITLNLAACSDFPGYASGCETYICSREKTASTEVFQRLEDELVLWIFTFLTFPFMVKG